MVKPVSQPCLRNQDPIYQAAQPYMTVAGRLLELASGTAQHAVYIASRLPHIHWQASEMPDRLTGANLWINEAALPNLPNAIKLNINADHWGLYETNQVDYIFSANLVHFVSQKSVGSIFSGINRILKSQGTVILYGPYNQDGFTSEGNKNLDDWLKSDVDPLAGLKELTHIISLAKQENLSLVNTITMPANNLLLIFKKH